MNIYLFILICTTTARDCKEKFRRLRNNFLTHYKKISSQRRVKTKSGQGIDDLPLKENQKPTQKWKFYEDLSFLVEFMIETPSKDSMVYILKMNMNNSSRLISHLKFKDTDMMSFEREKASNKGSIPQENYFDDDNLNENSFEVNFNIIFIQNLFYQ
jgi:hypothetical protein